MNVTKFLIIFFSSIIMSVLSIHVNAASSGFQFEKLTDESDEKVRTVLNETKTAKKLELKYSDDDIRNSDMKIYYETDGLYNYSNEAFTDFLEKNAKDRKCYLAVFQSDSPQSAYTVTVNEYPDHTDVFPETYYKKYAMKGYEKNRLNNSIERTASKYTDGGKVYICEFDWIFIGVVCDENDIPRYVVCNDSHVNFDKRSEQTETDNKEIKELLDTFDRLYNSYDWKVYDDNEHQYVFDFDFFVDVDKAIHGTLPDDYVFEPHGLESMAKNTIKTIDGRAYRFSKNGVCTGLYTGWSNTKNGKRFFRRGELVKGKTTINGKEYEFDKNGYLK